MESTPSISFVRCPTMSIHNQFPRLNRSVLVMTIVPAVEHVLREISTSAPHVAQSGNHSSSCSSSSHWAMISRMIGSSASSL